MNFNPFSQKSEYEKALQDWRKEIGRLEREGRRLEAHKLSLSPPQPEWYNKAKKT